MKLVVHSIEGAFRRTCAVVVRPSPDARVECGNERSLVTPAMGLNESFHLFQVTRLCPFTWLDDYLVAFFAVMLAHRELTYSEAKKVKPYVTFVFVERVCDVGFAGFQGQSDFG